MKVSANSGTKRETKRTKIQAEKNVIQGLLVRLYMENRYIQQRTWNNQNKTYKEIKVYMYKQHELL